MSVEKPLSKISIRILNPTYLPSGLCIETCTNENIIAVSIRFMWLADVSLGQNVYVLILPFSFFFSLLNSSGSLRLRSENSE